MLTRTKWRVALLQMHVEAGQPDVNFRRLEEMLEEAVSAEVKPDVILFPEMWNTGYALDRIGELADPGGRRSKAMLSEFSGKHGINIVGGSVARRTEEGVYNTVYAFDRQGLPAGEYSKIHLFRLMDEEKYLQPGTGSGAFALDGVRTGMMICYDLRFPELARKLALDGAKALFVPAEWPKPRLHHWRTLLMARAIENQQFVIACNRVGQSGETEFFGHSMIVDPWGEILAEGGEEEAVITADIDLSLADEVRGRIPVFEDRRPQHYASDQSPER